MGDILRNKTLRLLGKRTILDKDSGRMVRKIDFLFRGRVITEEKLYSYRKIWSKLRDISPQTDLTKRQVYWVNVFIRTKFLDLIFKTRPIPSIAEIVSTVSSSRI